MAIAIQAGDGIAIVAVLPNSSTPQSRQRLDVSRVGGLPIAVLATVLGRDRHKIKDRWGLSCCKSFREGSQFFIVIKLWWAVPTAA